MWNLSFQISLQRGIQLIGFVSLVLASTTFFVCGWTFYTHEFGDLYNTTIIEGCSPFPHPLTFSPVNPVTQVPGPGLDWSSSKSASCLFYLQTFLQVLIRNSLIAFLTSLVQIFVTGFLLHGTIQGVGDRGKVWIMFNIGINLMYLVCFTSSWTSPIPLNLTDGDVKSILSVIKYLSGYCVILACDIILGFISLLLAMLLVRYEKSLGYSLVNRHV